MQLKNYLRGKKCIARSEGGIRFREYEGKPSFFVPDIIVICNPQKTKDRWTIGAPDMIVEVLSPSTARRDRVIKLNRYMREGVAEYWIVSPGEQTVPIHLLEGGKYISNAYGPDEKVKVAVLDDCYIDLSQVFPPSDTSAPETDGEDIPD